MRDAHIPNPVVEQRLAHTLQLHVLALERKGERLQLAIASNGQLHLRARGAAHALDRVVEIIARDRSSVDRENAIIGAYAGAGGWRTLDRRNDPHDALLQCDFESDAGVFAR